MQRLVLSLLATCLFAAAYDAPFTTDADLAGYVGDLAGTIISSGGPQIFQHEGIEAVEIDGKPARILARGHDWLRVACPTGKHRVALRCGARRPVPPPSGADPAAALKAFTARLATAKPGDEIVIPNGTYLDWRVTIACSGTAAAPIVIRPETVGGVTFMRRTAFDLKGSHVVLRNFRFDQCDDRAITIAGGDRNRLTQLQFFHSGTARTTFAHIVRMMNESDENRIDHCYWTGSKCMSVGLRSALKEPEKIGKRNRIDYNVFRDIERIWINGQEAIQLGQGFPWVARPETRVEHNLFDNVWGDSEIFSSKTSANIFRYNVAANCRKAAFTLRGGDDALFEGNVVVNNAGGLRAFGRNHRIVNNLFLRNYGPAVQLQVAHLNGRSHGFPTTNILVAHNTMVGNGGGIGVGMILEREDWQPIGNRFVNNIFVGTGGVYISPGGQREPQAVNNLFQPGAGTQIGFAGEGALLVDAKLVGEGATVRPADDSPARDAARLLGEVSTDRYGTRRPVGNAPDLGAEELGSDVGARPFLPPVPEPRTWSLALYQAEPLNWGLGKEPITGNVKMAGELPADFVVTFEYRPASFETQASIDFHGTGPEDGYRLRWGGVEKEGIPSGLVHLEKRGEQVGEGPDTVYYRRNYVPSYPNKTVAIKRSEPFPDLWYEGRLLVHQNRIRLSLNIAQRRNKSPRSVGSFASVVWEDRGQVVGPVPKPGALSLSCTAGKGFWRNVRVWRARDLSRVLPTPPVQVAATALGPRAVRLSWADSDGFGASRRVEIYRGTTADFPLDGRHRIAGKRGITAFDDFATVPGTTYFYRLRAGNLVGQWSAPVQAVAKTPTEGPFFARISAGDFPVVKALMSRGRDPEEGLSYISGIGAGKRMEGPAEDGYADVRFRVPTTGSYAIWGLVSAPDQGSDSFYLSMPEINGGKPVNYYTGTGDGWFWSRLPVKAQIKLAAGEQQFRLHIRECKTRLAAILITDQLDWRAVGR